jgi:tetratricopeptide (TPR) repeat protein
MSERIERWRSFVAKDPENPLHNFALAQALLREGEHAEGEAAFARCLQLDPEWMMAAVKRGRCLVALERWDEARAALDLGEALAVKLGHDEPFEEIRELREQLPG